MARLVPTPQALVEQLRRVLPHPPGSHRRDGDGPTSTDRILDAALHAFTEAGIKATTMTRIARDAGLSREWLYRQFPGRDAVVVAVAQREVARFVDGLAVRSFHAEDLDGAVTEAFVYAVEFLRDHPALQQVVRTEPEILSGKLLHEASPVLGIAVSAGAGYLSAVGDLTPDHATIVAETLVRLVATATFAPRAVLDLHDPEQLRAYAAVVVPGVLAAASVRVAT